MTLASRVEARAENDLALPASGQAPQTEPLDFHLAVDGRLTTCPLVKIEDFGRCVAVDDLLALAQSGARNASEPGGAIRLSDGERQIDLEEDGTVCVSQAGRLYALLGYVSMRLGWEVEADPQLRYMRIVTPRNTTSRESFLEAHGGDLRNRRLRRAIEDREVRRGLLAVDDRLIEDAFSIELDGITYLPLEAIAGALGGSASAPLDVSAARLQGESGELALRRDAQPLRLLGFALHAASPLIDYRGATYIEDATLERAFKARIERFPEYDTIRFVRAEAAPGGVFSARSSSERMRPLLDKQNAQIFRTAYLTFDDGPSANVTPRVLEILGRYGAKATFFTLGKQAEMYPDLLRQVHREGHAVANHTYSHVWKNLYPNSDGLMAEVHRAGDVIEEKIGVRPKMFRAPYGTAGNFKRSHFDSLHAEGFQIYEWNLDSGDSRSLRVTADEIVENVRKGSQGKNELVVLFHDSATKEETAKALPRVIELLRQEGFELASLDYNTTIRTKGIVK